MEESADIEEQKRPLRATQVEKEADSNLFNIIQHFTRRGHTGAVQAIDATDEVDYIISGGADFTMRVWKYDEESDAYVLHAILEHAKPDGFVDEPEGGLCSGLCGTATEEVRPRQGVTAVAHASSRRLGFQEGQKVVLDQDADYIKQELDFVEKYKWEDFMEDMLGMEFNIKEIEDDIECLGLDTEQGVMHVPMTCVEPETKFPMRDGPFISGTAYGDVCVLSLQAEESKQRVTLPRLHSGKINEISVMPFDDQGWFYVATCADDGDVALLELKTEEVTAVEDADTDVSARSPRQSEEGAVLETAKTRKTVRTLTLALTGIEEMQRNGERLRLNHTFEGNPTPVLNVKHLGVGSRAENAASFASLTCEGAHLWSIEGQYLMRLSIQKQILVYHPGKATDILEKPEVTSYTQLAVCNKETAGTMLFLGGTDGVDNGYVAVWGLEDGKVDNNSVKSKNDADKEWENALDKFRSKKACPNPVTCYKRKGRYLDVDQSAGFTEFAAQTDSPYRCTIWRTQAIKANRLALEPKGGVTSLLVMSGREKLLMTLRHTKNIHCLKCIEDPDDAGPAVMVGCTGRVLLWDVEGVNAKQVYAQMRSLSLLEIFLPPVLMVVSTVQFMSFAFGPGIPWKAEVNKPAMKVHNFVMLDVRFSFSQMDIKEVAFWPQTLVTLVTLTIFVLSALLGLPAAMDKIVHTIQETSCYKEEQCKCGLAHLLLACMRGCRWLLNTLMYLCSTLMVVPICKTLAEATDCVHPSHGRPHLFEAPNVFCDEWKQIWARDFIICIFPFYLFALIPYAVVEGDSTYVPTTTLYDPLRALYDFKEYWKAGDNLWRNAAQRKATDVHMGILHPVPKEAFRYRALDAVVKVCLPFITILLTTSPLKQTVLVCVLGYIMLFDVLCFPPFLEEKYYSFVKHQKLFVVASMTCGAITTLLGELGHKKSIIPVVMLSVSMSMIALSLLYQLVTVRWRPRNIVVYQDTDRSPED